MVRRGSPSGRRLSLVALLCTALLWTATPAPAQDDLRDTVGDTVIGSLTYKERGPGASYDGIANSLLVGSAAPATAVRMGRSMEFFFDILENPLVQGALPEASMESVSEMMAQAAEMPQLPITAAYDAHISFKLKAGDDGIYRLESGIIDWSTDNSTSFAYEDASITDSFEGRGFESLDPASDTIDLSLAIVADQLQYTLDVDVSHEYLTDGTSVWTTPVASLTLDKTGADIELQADTAFGNSMQLPPMSLEGLEKSVLYLKQGTNLYLADALSGTETWRNLLDGQTVAQFTLAFGDCIPEITSPTEGKALVFDENEPAKLEGRATIGGIPGPFTDGVSWVFPPVPFEKDTYDPQDKQGGRVGFTYEELGPSNEDFGELELNVEYLSEPLQDLCELPATRTFRVFFPKDGENNPDGTYNWFYYWLQTDARSGVNDIEVHGSEDPKCQGVDGYYFYGTPIYLCHPSASEDSMVLVNGARTTFIDTTAVVVLHEDRHRRNWEAWGTQPRCTDTNGDGVPDPAEGCIVDTDGDSVPDDEEAHLLPFPLDPNDPTSCQDINGNPLPEWDDEHCVAYWAEINWPIDSVDDEDWASPGSQNP